MEKIMSLQTRYEKEHGIKVVNFRKIIGKEDIEIYALKKSDEQIGIFLRIKIGGDWVDFYPTKTQMEVLTKNLKDLYQKVNLWNTKHRKEILDLNNTSEIMLICSNWECLKTYKRIPISGKCIKCGSKLLFIQEKKGGE
jgi:DNA polymerase II large subunit